MTTITGFSRKARTSTGCLIHPESGGPHAVPIDAQQCLGFNDAPMSEFWAWSWRHRVGDENRFFVKQPASAAHTYGHKLVLAEGFTTIGPHWQETLWDNLKPSFDHACTEGLEPAGVARLRLLARERRASRASNTSPARTSIRT